MKHDLLTTQKLEKHIRAQYAKLKSFLKKNDIDVPLDEVFAANHGVIDGSYCFADQFGYHYRLIERGVMEEDLLTQDLFEITYSVLSNEIFEIAEEYECEHRIEGQDFRRLLFDTELMLWKKIGNDYAQRALQEIEEDLAEAPFVDETDPD